MPLSISRREFLCGGAAFASLGAFAGNRFLLAATGLNRARRAAHQGEHAVGLSFGEPQRQGRAPRSGGELGLVAGQRRDDDSERLCRRTDRVAHAEGAEEFLR